MSRFISNKTTKRITIVLVIMMLCNFIFANFSVRAEDDEDDLIGGILGKPVRQLIVFFGDSIMSLMQGAILGDPNIGEKFTNDFSQEVYNATMKERLSWNLVGDVWAGIQAGWDFYFTDSTVSWFVPNFQYGVHKIFSNKIYLFDVNYINPKDYSDQKKESIAATLQRTIAKWYINLRNIAIVALLSILVYTGIRIIISSSASEKAKYKQLITNWIVGLCLVFFMHYFMSFILTFNNMLTESITAGDMKLYVEYDVSQFETVQAKLKDTSITMPAGVYADGIEELIRIKADYVGMEGFGDSILYFAIISLTLTFTFIYLKRTIMIAFLTLISPMVAMTYTLDKMNDGKSQAFDMWIKEYLCNVLIQPVHLILYTILITSAVDIVKTNQLYAFIAICALLPAEKFIRKMFGFEKSSTVGSAFGGAATGALLGSAISHLGKLGAKGLKQGKGPGGRNDNEKMDNNSKIRVDQSAKERTDKLSAFRNGDGQDDAGQMQQQSIGAGDEMDDQTEGTDDTPLPSADPLLDKYKSEGFGQNVEGEYFNPYTDEYDPDYDPHNDPSYMSKQEDIPSGMDDSKGMNGSGGMNFPIETNYKSGINDSNIKSSINPQKNIAGNKKTIKRPSKLANAVRFTGRFARNLASPITAKSVANFAGNVAKLGVGFAGAATLGGLGFVAGAATGDVGKAFSLGTAGAMAGKNLGQGAVNLVGQGANTIGKVGSHIGNSWSEAKDGGVALREKELKKQDELAKKNYMRNQAERNKAIDLKRQYYANDSSMTVDKLMEKTYEYRRAGIEQDKDIEKGIKYEATRGLKQDQAIGLMQFKNEISKSELQDNDLRPQTENRVRKLVGGNNETTDQVMELLDDAYKVTRLRTNPTPRPSSNTGNNPRRSNGNNSQG